MKDIASAEGASRKYVNHDVNHESRNVKNSFHVNSDQMQINSLLAFVLT